MAISCRCYRCSKRISDSEIKRISVKIDANDNAFAFCEECVKALEAWISGEDMESESDEHTVTVDREKVNNLVVKTVMDAAYKREHPQLAKFEEREQKAVKMEELDKLDQRKPKEHQAPANEEDVYNITFASLNRFNRAIKLLEQNHIEFKHLQHVDGIEDMPWGVLQIRREDYKLWRKVYLDAENKEASEVKPVTITLPEKPVRKVEPVEERPTIRKVEPVKIKEPCKADVDGGKYLPIKKEDVPLMNRNVFNKDGIRCWNLSKADVDGGKYPPIKKEDVPFRNRNAFNKGGVRCWNLIYFILKSGSSATEVAEAYGLRPLAFQNMTSASYMSETRVNKLEPYEVKDIKLVKALKKFAEDNGVRYEDLVYVRDIQGPFEELYFKPAPDKISLDKNPVSYN